MRDADRTTGQGPSDGQGSRRGGRQTALAFAGVLALVLIVLGVGSFLARRSGGTVDVRPIGAEATATGTAGASVRAGSALTTGTATGAPTIAAIPATAVPTASAASVTTPTAAPVAAPAATPTAASTPAVLPSIAPTTARTVVYSTNFANWFQGDEGGQYPIRASIDPTNGEYRMSLLGPQRGYANYRAIPDGHQFDNFQIDVDARKIAGPDNGGYGLVFRVQSAVAGAATYERYNFVVRADGSYSLNLISTEGRGTPIAPRGTSSAIVQGNAANHLTVICRGSQITLIVNGQMLGTFTGPLTAPGTVGVYVGDLSTTSDAPLIEVAFSNFIVSTVP